MPVDILSTLSPQWSLGWVNDRPILQMRKVNHGKFKQLAQGYTARKQ